MSGPCLGKIHERVASKTQYTVRVTRSAGVGSDEVFASNDAHLDKPFLCKSAASGIRLDANFHKNAAAPHAFQLHPNLPRACSGQQIEHQNSSAQGIICTAFYENLTDKQQIAHAPPDARALAPRPRFIVQGQRSLLRHFTGGAIHLRTNVTQLNKSR